MNTLIFSKCKLLTFSFEYVFNHVFSTRNLKEVIMKSYDTIDPFINAINQNTKLVLIDITSVDYIDAYSMLKEIKEKSKVIVLCDSETELHILPKIYNAVLYKTSSILNIIITIERVCDNKCNDMIVDLDSDDFEMPELTKIEKSILELIISGVDNDQIAKLLLITREKVMGYRCNICKKYNINSLSVQYHKDNPPYDG
ncbi:two component system sensor kinase SsrB [Yersinia rohdei]|nr:two component system sensor kinase SsrB [Yersinia rohdei]